MTAASKQQQKKKTLTVRIARRTLGDPRPGAEAAAVVAEALAAHPKISRLIYPGRADHPQADGEEADARGLDLVGFEVNGGEARVRCSMR